MKMMEIIKAAKTSDAKAFANVEDKQAAAIAKAVLAQINRYINEQKEDRISIGGFGKFRIKPVEREIQGRMVVKKHIVFQPLE